MAEKGSYKKVELTVVNATIDMYNILLQSCDVTLAVIAVMRMVHYMYYSLLDAIVMDENSTNSIKKGWYNYICYESQSKKSDSKMCIHP